MAALEAHSLKQKANRNTSSVVSYDKASFESLDGSCTSSQEASVVSPHPGSRDLPPSRDERVDGWLRTTLRTEEPS